MNSIVRLFAYNETFVASDGTPFRVVAINRVNSSATYNNGKSINRMIKTVAPEITDKDLSYPLNYCEFLTSSLITGIKRIDNLLYLKLDGFDTYILNEYINLNILHSLDNINVSNGHISVNDGTHICFLNKTSFSAMIGAENKEQPKEYYITRKDLKVGYLYKMNKRMCIYMGKYEGRDNFIDDGIITELIDREEGTLDDLVPYFARYALNFTGQIPLLVRSYDESSTLYEVTVDDMDGYLEDPDKPDMQLLKPIQKSKIISGIGFAYNEDYIKEKEHEWSYNYGSSDVSVLVDRTVKYWSHGTLDRVAFKCIEEPRQVLSEKECEEYMARPPINILGTSFAIRKTNGNIDTMICDEMSEEFTKQYPKLCNYIKKNCKKKNLG